MVIGFRNDREAEQVASHYTSSLDILFLLKVINFLMCMKPLSVSLPALSAFICQTEEPYLRGLLTPLL